MAEHSSRPFEDSGSTPGPEIEIYSWQKNFVANMGVREICDVASGSRKIKHVDLHGKKMESN